MATALNEKLYGEALELARKARRRPTQKHKPTSSRGFISEGSPHRAAVRALQERLSELGYEISNDGIFGAETRRAVREFQADKEIDVDGIVGRQTLGKLTSGKRKPEPEGAIAIDSIARVVGAGQSQRARSGTGLGRIKANQKGEARTKSTSSTETKKGPHGGIIDATGHERASAQTGPIGSTTLPKPDRMSWEDGKQRPSDPAQPQNNNTAFNELHPRGPGGEFAQKGDTGEQVTSTQTALNKAGGAKLKTDGVFGDKTEAAVISYQKKNNLTVDGVVGPETSGSLRKRLGRRTQRG